MKILAIQNRMGIGDMIIYLPFIEAISKKYNTKVNILVKENSKASEILKDDRYVGEIINLDRTNKNKKGTHDGIFGSINLTIVFISGLGAVSYTHLTLPTTPYV